MPISSTSRLVSELIIECERSFHTIDINESFWRNLHFSLNMCILKIIIIIGWGKNIPLHNTSKQYLTFFVGNVKFEDLMSSMGEQQNLKHYSWCIM